MLMLRYKRKNCDKQIKMMTAKDENQTNLFQHKGHKNPVTNNQYFQRQSSGLYRIYAGSGRRVWQEA